MSPSPIIGAEPKAWWQSRSIIGSVVVIVSLVSGIFGWSVDSEETTEIVLQVAGLVGAALAIYGRVKAVRPIMRVRKALPTTSGPQRRYKFPKAGGYYELPALIAGVIWVLLVACLYAAIAWAQSEASGSMEWREMMARRDAMLERQVLPPIRWTSVEDDRPFLVRLLESIRVVPGAHVSVSEEGIPMASGTKVTIHGGVDF